MNIPQSLLDRREELAGGIEHHERQQEILQTALNELDGAIRTIGNEPVSGRVAEVAEDAAQPGAGGPYKFPDYVAPQAPASAGASGQRAAKRDIKALVMDVIRKSTVPHTTKEITKAIMAAPQSVASALEYWKGYGSVAEVDGKWHLVAATNASADAETAPLVPRSDSEPPAAEAPTDAIALSTQDKLVQALKAAGTAGMTDQELAAAGIPYIATMQYHRLGWMRLDNGRYYLSAPVNG